MQAEEREGLSRWAKIRALLITLAMAVGLVAGLPLPSDAQREKLPEAVRASVDRVSRTQRALLGPFDFIGREFELYQRWQLFAGARTERYWLRIDARRAADTDFRLLYRPHDSAHTFLAHELEYRRVRGAWNPRRGEAQAGYGAFASWVSRRIFLEQREVVEVRVSIERIRIPERGGRFEPTGEFLYPVVNRRNDLLP